MRATIIEKIRNAGVVGAGGAGLPAHVKADATVDTVLVNGASCEPLLMSDPHLMAAETDAVLAGLRALMNCTGATRGVLCLKGKHAQAMKKIRAAVARDSGGCLEAFELGDFYPAGDEHVLVNEVLGRVVPERGIPLQVGAVVSNVESLYNVARAMSDKPVTHRYLTVTGEVNKHAVLKVPVGTPVSEVLAWAGGPAIAEYKVVDGGPMMGKVLPDDDRPVTKTTSGLIVLPPDHTVVARKILDPARVRRLTGAVCCQCSLCTDLCPRNLLGHSIRPHKIMRVAESQTVTSAIAREALLCSECGVCEKFACPMLVSPREVNAQIKKVLMREGISWETANRNPQPGRFRAVRHIPTARLVQRLNVASYDTHPRFEGEIEPSLVNIPLSQHIGAPALCVVKAGDRVKAGDLIGEMPDKAMSARVHASIDGVVDSVANGMITIKAR